MRRTVPFEERLTARVMLDDPVVRVDDADRRKRIGLRDDGQPRPCARKHTCSLILTRPNFMPRIDRSARTTGLRQPNTTHTAARRATPEQRRQSNRQALTRHRGPRGNDEAVRSFRARTSGMLMGISPEWLTTSTTD